jgi:type II secretory pathway component PulC
MQKQILKKALQIISGLLLFFMVQIADAQNTPTAQKYSDGHDLGILIMGTISNRVSSDNVALIKEASTGRVRAVKPSFEIVGYRVREVSKKYVMLVKNNQTHLVYLNKFSGEFKQTAPVVSQTPTSYAALTDHYSEEGFERKGEQINISAKLRDKLVGEDLSTVLMQATALPEFIEGKIIGFKMLQIDAGSIFDKAGVRDHDVVTNINGIKLDSIPGAIKLLKSLKGTEQVSVELRRSGTPIKLNLNVGH